jgi:hypothetical protein
MYRVSGWLDEDGLIKKLESVVKEVLADIKSVAAVATLGAATVVSMPASAGAVAWMPNVGAQTAALQSESAQDRVARLDAAMEHHIARFMSPDQSDLDPRLVAAAADFLRVVRLPG